MWGNLIIVIQYHFTCLYVWRFLFSRILPVFSVFHVSYQFLNIRPVSLKNSCYKRVNEMINNRRFNSTSYHQGVFIIICIKTITVGSNLSLLKCNVYIFHFSYFISIHLLQLFLSQEYFILTVFDIWFV
jgi:cobalamin biosynthesis protein CobD/CbiB